MAFLWGSQSVQRRRKPRRSGRGFSAPPSKRRGRPCCGRKCCVVGLLGNALLSAQAARAPHSRTCGSGRSTGFGWHSHKPAPCPNHRLHHRAHRHRVRAGVGITKATPHSAASRCAPALVLKFSSLQVRPESQYSTGTAWPCGARRQIHGKSHAGAGAAAVVAVALVVAAKQGIA